MLAGALGGTSNLVQVSSRILVPLFRIIATAEAVSWAGLLVGMYFKYLTDAGELGVEIFGPIHGGIFVAYVLMTILVSRAAGWGRWTTVIGLACSVPPFATYAFELWAQRTGRLTRAAHRSPDLRLDASRASGDRV